MEKNWEDDFTNLEKKIKAAQIKMSGRQLNSHTDILTKFITKPEEEKENESQNGYILHFIYGGHGIFTIGYGWHLFY